MYIKGDFGINQMRRVEEVKLNLQLCYHGLAV